MRSVVRSWNARIFLPAALAASTACASSTRTSAGTFEEDLEAFYSAFEVEVERALQELEPDDREQLRDIMPRAEFEGATFDVLDVIATRAALRPMVRRIERFLSNEPAGAVRNEVLSNEGDRRLWHILLDTINDDLGRPST